MCGDFFGNFPKSSLSLTKFCLCIQTRIRSSRAVLSTWPSKFSYLLFSKLGEQIVGTTNSKPPVPIIRLGQSEILSSSQMRFICCFYGAGERWCTSHQSPQTVQFWWAQTIFLIQTGIFSISSSNFTVQDHILTAAEVNQQPPMHQFWMRLSWPFWDEPKPFNLNHTKHWSGLFFFISLAHPSLRFQKISLLFFLLLFCSFFVLLLFHHHLLVFHCCYSFFFIIVFLLF